MSSLSGSLPSIGAIGSLAAFSQMPPSSLVPATLPRVDLVMAATPDGPSIRPPSNVPATTAQSEVRPPSTPYAPASLPVVDWALVPSIPQPPPAHYASPIGTPTPVAQHGGASTSLLGFGLAQPMNLDPLGPYGQARS